MDKGERRNYYEIAKLKEIPITSVCDLLHLEIEKKGRNDVWCKARQEHTASTLIHLDKNTFHDFGTGAGGDVISFYAYVTGVSVKDALQALGKAFGIEPSDSQYGLASYELTPWEWKALGIYGDMASKNFTFDVDRMPLERIVEISDRYSISVNELRKAHPKRYERMIKEQVLPYVRNLRNQYFLNVYEKYSLCKEIGKPELFDSEVVQQELEKSKLELESVKRLISKAIHGTSLSFAMDKVYEPKETLELLLHGEIKPQLGTLSYWEMQRLAKSMGSQVQYSSIDYANYHSSGLEDYRHTGFLKGDRVIVGYLPDEEKPIKGILMQYKQGKKKENMRQNLFSFQQPITRDTER